MAYCENCGCDGREAEAEVASLRVTLAAKEEALRRYGRHKDIGCAEDQILSDPPHCRCGLAQALSTPTPASEDGDCLYYEEERG